MPDFFSKRSGNKKQFTIKDIKNLIIGDKDKESTILTLDNFVSFQNGNLLTIFADKRENKINKEKMKIYKKSQLYKLAFSEESSEHKKNSFQRIVGAFENFKDFLNNDKIEIDYTYLWDIVCNKNGLFQSIKPVGGLNLVILEIPEDDLRTNVNIICPTNIYSNDFFDSKRETLILIKYKGFFEPIYTLQYTINKKDNKEFDIGLGFSSKSKGKNAEQNKVFKKIVDILDKIKLTLNKNCGPFPSLSPKVYDFKQNISLSKMIEACKKYNIEIKELIINYNEKVIGIIAEYKFLDREKSVQGYLPCFPSGINYEYSIKYNDDDIWSGFQFYQFY